MAAQSSIVIAVALLVSGVCFASSTVTPAPDDKVELALVKKEVDDLKAFVNSLVQQVKNQEQKNKDQDVEMNKQMKNQEIQIVTLKTKQDMHSDILKGLSAKTTLKTVDELASLKAKTTNLTEQQRETVRIQNTLVTGQQQLKLETSNNTARISSHGRHIQDNKNALSQLQLRLNNVSHVANEDVSLLGKEQKNLHSRLNLQSHVINNQILFTKDLKTRLDSEVTARQKNEAVINAELSRLHAADQIFKNKTVEFQASAVEQEKLTLLVRSQGVAIAFNEGNITSNTQRIQAAETAIEKHQKTLKGVGQKEVTHEARIELHSTKLKNLGIQLTTLENKPNAQPILGITQHVWRAQTSTNNGIIKYMNFHKKIASSALRVTYASNAYTSSGYCNRRFFTFNGAECNNPEKIESLFYLSSASSYNPIEVSGICYGLKAGTTRIDLKIGPCPSYSYTNSVSGWNTASRIIVEEINVVSH